MTLPIQLSVDQLFEAPDFHLFALEGDRATFLRMDAASYRSSIFIDGRIVPAHPKPFSVPVAPLLRYREAQHLAAAETGWIFHIAQCGSTLLARALDRPDRNLVLREPLALRQLGVGRAAIDAASDEWQARLRLVACFLGRRYRADLPTVVKANVPVNMALPDIATLSPRSPAIFLYFPLETYLLATLRSPGHRQWVERVTNELAPALAPMCGGLGALTPTQRAAALWLTQMRAFSVAMERFENSRSLDAETLFNSPRPVLERSAALFGAPFEPVELDAILAGPLFSTYSKNPARKFDNDARLARQAETRMRLRSETEAARHWLDRLLASHPIPDRLPRPLAGEAPALLG